MALSASTVLEVRTTGNDTNGGGFVTGSSGTDWSQQNSPQYSVTDGVTAGTTTITSTTASFGTDVVGNLVYVQGGTGSVVAGWYQITARVNATTITVDRSTGLSVGTGATVRIGGALATPGMASFVKTTAGMEVWIKAGTYTLTSSTASVSGGPISDTTGGVSLTDLSVWRGYNTVRGDLTTRPVISAGSITGITMMAASASRTAFMNIELDANNGASNIGVDMGGLNNGVAYMKVSNAKGISYNNGSFHFMCEAVNCQGTNSFFSGNVTAAFISCVARDTSTTTHNGFFASGGSGATYIQCVASGLTGTSAVGFVSSTSGYPTLSGCVAYNIGHDGFNISPTVGGLIENCIAYSCGRYGFTSSNGSEFFYFLQNCAGGNNTTANIDPSSFTASVTFSFVALTGNPFTNAGSNDFSLNNTAGAGAALRGTGFPSLPGGTTVAFPDIGVAQHKDTAGYTGFIMY